MQITNYSGFTFTYRIFDHVFHIIYLLKTCIAFYKYISLWFKFSLPGFSVYVLIFCNCNYKPCKSNMAETILFRLWCYRNIVYKLCNLSDCSGMNSVWYFNSNKLSIREKNINTISINSSGNMYNSWILNSSSSKESGRYKINSSWKIRVVIFSQVNLLLKF